MCKSLTGAWKSNGERESTGKPLGFENGRISNYSWRFVGSSSRFNKDSEFEKEILFLWKEEEHELDVGSE